LRLQRQSGDFIPAGEAAFLARQQSGWAQPGVDHRRKAAIRWATLPCRQVGTENEFLLLAIGVSDQLMLAQMLNPGVKFERFEKTAFLRQTLEDLPLEKEWES
jgi:hypothetical protein